MKPFDLEAAKAGAPVCTENGIPVRILCFDRKGSEFPIIALKDNTDSHESFSTFTKRGEETPCSKVGISLKMRDDDYVEKLVRGEYGPTVKENLTVDNPTCKDS